MAVALADGLVHGGIVAPMGDPLAEELSAAADAATRLLETGESLLAVIPAEPSDGLRLYLCAFEQAEQRSWLVLDASHRPVADRALVREAASIVAICELAEESAGGGDVTELLQRLDELRRRENPEGIDEAHAAAVALARALGEAPRVADPGYLDRVGQAATALESALGESGGSPFAEAMRTGMAIVESVAEDVEQGYRLPLA